MRLARHSVRLNGGNGNNIVVDDWLWIDYHDRINVLVEAPPSSSSRPVTTDTANDGPSSREEASLRVGEASFMILSQTKYALDRTSLAVVGGIIEPNEEAYAAARREVGEELRVTCRSWKTLGKFRTDVNRGMGWVHPYLARDCAYASITKDHDGGGGNGKDIVNSQEVGGHDTEKQLIQTMRLSEVKRAVMEGKFAEVQWSNTVALAMLHLSSSD